MSQPFSDAEEAFIKAQEEVYQTSEAVMQAEDAHVTACEAANKTYDGLEQEDTREAFDRLYELMLEAAHRAGFSDEDRTVKPVVEAYKMVSEAMEKAGV